MYQLDNSKNRKLWEIALIGITALWGWSFVAIHDALNSVSASAFNFYRFFCAALILGVVFVFKKRKITRHDIMGGMVAGVVLYFAFLCQTSGLKLTTASNASFITGLAVVFTPLILFVCFSLKIERKQFLGAALATIGLAFLTLKDVGVHIGDVLVLLCAICFAFHIVILSRVSKTSDTVNITLIQVLVVGLLSLIQSVVLGEMSMPQGSDTIIAILVIGVFGTAIGFFVQTKAQIASSPNRIALIIVLEPVFGGFFGYILADDHLTIMNWLGAFLILLGMLITEVDIRAWRKKTNLT